jgi:hypothetical protein
MSIEIINKDNRKCPFIFNGHKTNFKTKLEEQKYWAEEYRRWLEGYAGLMPRHYFYLTMGTLKPIQGLPIKPVWRDVDAMIFEADAETRRIGHTLNIIKRREVGLTSIYGGNEPIYNCLTMPGSINLITSADKTRVKNLFSDKTMFMYDNLSLPDYMMPHKKSERQEGFLNLASKKNKGGVGAGSQVYCLETADNDRSAKRFETFRAMSIFLDELFLHPRADIVFKSSQACLRQSFQVIGHMTIGGSCGGDTVDEINALKNNADMIEQMIGDADALDMTVVFIPGTLGINGADELDDNGRKTGNRLSFMENGYSNTEKAKEWIEKKRTALKRAKDQSHYNNFVKSYPLTIEEVFQVNRAGIMPPEVYENLQAAKIKIEEKGGNKFFSMRKDSQTEKYEIKENSKGKFVIIADPDPCKTYLAGTDPIPFNQSAIIDEGSEYALMVYCLEDEAPVAYYAERNLDADHCVGQGILLQERYRSIEFPDGAPAMIENNRGEVAIRIYKELNKYSLLANRPKNLGFIYEENSAGEKKGWYSNDKTIARANTYAINILKLYGDRIGLRRLVDEAARWPNANNDLFDALKSLGLFREEYILGKKKTQKIGVSYIEVPYLAPDKSGRMVRHWKRQEIK